MWGSWWNGEDEPPAADGSESWLLLLLVGAAMVSIVAGWRLLAILG